MRKIVFKHNDLARLEEALQSLPVARPKIIAFESVCSMKGDISPVSAPAMWLSLMVQ